MSKYKNLRVAIGGEVFDSKKEAARWQELHILERCKAISNLERQKKFDIVVNGMKICSYLSDFTYTTQDGREVVEDVKGIRTPVYRLKAKLMLAVHQIRVIEI